MSFENHLSTQILGLHFVQILKPKKEIGTCSGLHMKRIYFIV